MATELSSRIATLKALASFEPRPLRPGFSGREPFAMPQGLQETRQRLLDRAAEPYVGITTDGTPVPGLYDLHPTGVSTRSLLDAATALLAMRDGVIPPVGNLDEPNPAYGLDLVQEAREAAVDLVLVNARGYGGFNTSIVLRRVADRGGETPGGSGE